MFCRYILVVFIALQVAVPSCGYYWKGLEGFDEENYLCYHFHDLCENYLEQIGCGTNSSHNSIVGCPGYPAVPNNISHFKGTCACQTPVVSSSAGGRIINEIISNRIVPEMGWMLEPWQSGPPYDYSKSYQRVCNKLLNRLGCTEEDMVILANHDTGKYKCSCGTLTTPDVAVQNIITDQINKLKLSQMPVFENPVYLSTSLSICIVLIVGKLGAIVACSMKLPAVVGYILAGLGIQNFLHPMVLKGVGFPFPSVASEMRLLALCLVLMRAGLTVNTKDITSSIVPTLSFALVPYLSEMLAFMYTGVKLFGWSQVEMGLFASMMAALGPSVVIPPMLTLIASKKKNFGFIPKQILLSAPLESVIAVVLFSIFTILNQDVTDPFYPWVKVLPLYANCLLIPVNIIFSCVMGVVLGYAISRYVNFRSSIVDDAMWAFITKNIQIGSSTADFIFILFVSCYTMMSLCTKQYIQQSSGVLVVFVCCVSLAEFCEKNITKDIAEGLKGIWVFAEVFLFTFVGTNLALDPSNGPLMGQRGMSADTFKKVIACMLVGTCARFIGHIISACISWPSMLPHRRSAAWQTRYVVAAWACQLPKAAVQGTLGGVAYAMAIIPGPQGINKGLIIMQSAAIAILIFASLGTMISTYIGKPLCLTCSAMDLAAGYDSQKLQYFKVDESTAQAANNISNDDDEQVTGIELTDHSQQAKDDSDTVEVVKAIELTDETLNTNNIDLEAVSA